MKEFNLTREDYLHIPWRERDGKYVVKDYGTFYYKNEERHRLDGPAIQFDNGDEFWLVNDWYHRLDGPARNWKDGTHEYWINGKEYSKEEYDIAIAEIYLRKNKLDNYI